MPWWYELVVAAEHPGPLPATAGGFSFHVEHGLEALVGRGHDRRARLARRAVGGGAWTRCGASGARLVSICSGVFLLAATGVLDGCEAATHWRYAAKLAERYPKVKVNADVLYVDGGDVLTSAGSAAGIDLCLHVVRRDHGAAVANAVARRLVIPPHRDGGQAQLIDLPMPAHPDDDPIARVMAWALERLHQPLDLETLAARAYMSVRTFTRRFRRATGTTPGPLAARAARAGEPAAAGGRRRADRDGRRRAWGSAARRRTGITSRRSCGRRRRRTGARSTRRRSRSRAGRGRGAGGS